MDQIIIKDLVAHGIIGVYEWERKEPQKILINLILFTDLHASGEVDNLELSTDYEEVANKVRILAEKSGRFTVEALAADVARLCLEIPNVSKVRVRIEKPGALRFSGSVGIEIERCQED